MKVVNVVITALSNSKNNGTGTASKRKPGRKLDLTRLVNVATYMKGYPFMFEGLEDELKKIKKNTTYTFDPNKGNISVSADSVTDMGKMKLARFDEDAITFHNLQVYSYMGDLYGLEKDFDKLFDI